MLVSASVTPSTAVSVASIRRSNSKFSSIGTANGSISQGELHSATAAGSSTSRTGSRCTRAEARAISTASAGAALHSRPRQLLGGGKSPAALTQHPHSQPQRLVFGSHRHAPVSRPQERTRSSTIRASAWLAPCATAIPNAQSAICFISTPAAPAPATSFRFYPFQNAPRRAPQKQKPRSHRGPSLSSIFPCCSRNTRVSYCFAIPSGVNVMVARCPWVPRIPVVCRCRSPSTPPDFPSPASVFPLPNSSGCASPASPDPVSRSLPSCRRSGR